MTNDVSKPALSARALHADALVWDNHACVPHGDVPLPTEAMEAFRQGGVDAVTLNIGDADVSIGDQMRTVASIRQMIDAHPDQYVFATSAADIRRAKASGRLAISLDLEGFYGIGTQVSMLRVYRQLGVGWAFMAYNRGNAFASGCHDDVDKGLTPLGFDAVREMDRLGIIKCCSHMGYRSAMDILTNTDKPTIFSHSNPLTLRSHERNIPDDLIQACAATGGVVGLVGLNLFLPEAPTMPEALAIAADHVANLVGPQHLAIGLDHEAGQHDDALRHQPRAQDYWPQSKGYGPQQVTIMSPDQLPDFTEALLKRGYGEAAIRGILGENLLRVAEQVWPK